MIKNSKLHDLWPFVISLWELVLCEIIKFMFGITGSSLISQPNFLKQYYDCIFLTESFIVSNSFSVEKSEIEI